MSLEIHEVKYSTFPYRVRDGKQDIAMFKNAGHAKLFIEVLGDHGAVCEHKNAYRGIYHLEMTTIVKGRSKKMQEAGFVRDKNGSLQYCPFCGAIRNYREYKTPWHKSIDAFLQNCIRG